MALYIDKRHFDIGRLFAVALGVICVSSFIFPFSFTFFPSQNTKNIGAVAGVVLLVLNLLKKREFAREMPKDLVYVLAAALGVGFMAFVSATYNSTYDYEYVSYIISAIVWILAAYFAANVIKWIHGYISLSLVVQYLTAVCVMQCVLALIFDNSPAAVDFFGRYIVGMSNFLKDSGRLFGIGCMLDVAGVRFSGMLILIGQYCIEASRHSEKKKLAMAMVCFLFITFVGNMIARTTTVGVILTLVLWIIPGSMYLFNRISNKRKMWGTLALILAVAIPIIVGLYQTNGQMRENIRFGFEGFFSLVEKGHWETNSNNQLETMVVWPDNPKTWIIGDGYFSDPGATDPYYLSKGIHFDVFYMSTDIGYCRFIFYFGIIGLLAFIFYFFVCAQVCGKRFPRWRLAFLFVFLVNLVVWAKVATDVFPVIAIALVVGAAENREAEIRAAVRREDEYELEEYSKEEIEAVKATMEDDEE